MRTVHHYDVLPIVLPILLDHWLNAEPDLQLPVKAAQVLPGGMPPAAQGVAMLDGDMLADNTHPRMTVAAGNTPALGCEGQAV